MLIDADLSDGKRVGGKASTVLRDIFDVVSDICHVRIVCTNGGKVIGTVGTIVACQRLFTMYESKRGVEAFLYRPDLFTEQVDYVQKAWVNLEPSEQFSKVLFAYLEATPCIALTNETTDSLAGN